MYCFPPAILTNRVISGALSTGQQNNFKTFTDKRTSFAHRFVTQSLC